jgi:protein O-mannosyl-transferase
VIATAGVAAYTNALGHPFLFDDAGAIVDNQTIRTLWTSVLGGPDQFPTAGRPLLNASFALNYAVGALTPWGYHAINLGVHVLCAIVLFALTRRVLRLPRMPAVLKGQESGFAMALRCVA